MIVGQSPQGYGFEQSRWSLKHLLCICTHLKIKSKSCLWNWLKKWKISYKRGRLYVHSPDADYQAKLAYIKTSLETADIDNSVFICIDQLTIYAHPSVSCAYAKQQPLAKQGWQHNKTMRIMGGLNILTGKVDYFIRNKISVATIYCFYQELVNTYPDKQIYIILDNWPMHYHPDILAALQAQDCPFKLHVPASWKHLKPAKKYNNKNLPIKLLPLPTYASWLNVIEKLWRKLKQELLHMHPFKDQFQQLKQQVKMWLDKYNSPQNHDELRSYVGLMKDDNFLGNICNEIYSKNQRTFIL